jgi:hypothetical protein
MRNCPDVLFHLHPTPPSPGCPVQACRCGMISAESSVGINGEASGFAR